MKRSLSNLETRANVIKQAIITGENTADRVGAWMLDTLHSATFEYDPAQSYPVNCWVIFGGVLCRSMAQTAPGQSPETHPMLWDRKMITDPELITENGQNLPVAGPALYEFVLDRLNQNGGDGGDVPDADTTTKGKVRRGGIEDFEYLMDESGEEKDDINAYVGPGLLLFMLDLIFGKGDLDAALSRGNVSGQDATVGKINRTKFDEGEYTHITGLVRRNGVWSEVLIPKDLISGGSGGSQLPTAPAGGVPNQTLTEGQFFSHTLTAWTNTDEYEVKNLPAGLSFNTGSRTISGTPTASGNYVIAVTGIKGAGRNTVSAAYTVQPASVTRTLDRLTIQRIGTSALKLVLTGEGGPEGIRLKIGTTGEGFAGAGFADFVKTGNKTYEFTVPTAPDDDYTVRVEQKFGSGSFQVGFQLNTSNQSEQVYPVTANLITNAGLFTGSSNGAGELDNLKNQNLADTFETEVDFQPIIGAFINFYDQTLPPAVFNRALIYTNNPGAYAGAYVLVGTEINQARGTLQDNLNRPTLSYRPVVGTESPLTVDLTGLKGKTVAVQSPNTTALQMTEFQVFGFFEAENHPPVIQTITNIERPQGGSASIDFKPFASDVDGDTITHTLLMEGGFPLPSWMSFPNAEFKFSNAPWEGGSLASVFEYSLQYTATDEHGSSTTVSFKVRIQKAGTLDSLQLVKIHYDYIGPQKRLTIGAQVTDAGPMRVNLRGNGFIYSGEGWKGMWNGTPDYFGDTNKLIDEASDRGGFSNVIPGNYFLDFQEYENGPVITRAIEIPSANINSRTVFTKGSTGPTDPEVPTPVITSVTHFIDANGKPIITATALNAPQGLEIAIVQINGSGWNATGYGAAPLVFGNSTFQRAYNIAAPQGSYRYDVRVVGTGIVQSAGFTVGATAVDFFRQVDWREITVGVNEEVLPYFNLYVQGANGDGAEWKWLNDPGAWRPLTVIQPNGISILSGATLYAELDYNLTPTSQVARTLQIKKTGTDQIINVTVPGGYPPHDAGSGPIFPIWQVALHVEKASYAYDANNDSFVAYFKPKDASKVYQVMLETVDGSSENGSNFGTGTDSGQWGLNVWYDLRTDYIPMRAEWPARRRFESTGGTGVKEVQHRLKIREKNVDGSVQIITFTPSATDGDQLRDLPISGVIQEPNNPNPQPTGTKIMMLGDSLQDDPRGRLGFGAALTASGKSYTFVGSRGTNDPSLNPRHEGNPGFTIDQTKAIVVDRINTYDPEIICLMIGPNDIAGNVDLPLAPSRLKSLVDTIMTAKPNVKLIVSTIPPQTISGNNAKVNTFNAAIPEIVSNAQVNGRVVQFVNINASMTTDDVDTDGIHLKASGYQKMANGWKAGFDALTAPPPSTSTGLTRTREVFGVKHFLAWQFWTPQKMAELKDEVGGFFDSGGTGVKFTMCEHVWSNSTGKQAFKDFFHWVVNVRRKKFALNFQMAFSRFDPMPGYMDESKAELYTNNGGYEQAWLTPSFSQNDGFTAWRENGNTDNWNNSTPKKRLYDDMVIPCINELKAIGPIWFLSQGRTHTGEGGYNSNVYELASARFGGNETAERENFRNWLYLLGGGNIAGVRNLLGNQSLTHEQLVPPTPSRNSWESFWGVFKGPGLPLAWYLFRTKRVREDQKMFEWYCRNTAPGIAVGFECGTFRGNQAVVNGTTEVAEISSTADFVKANLTWADDWALGGDVGRGLKEIHQSDGDQSLWDPVLQLWRRGYGIPGQYSHNDVAKMMISYLNANGYVGCFGDLRMFFEPVKIMRNSGIIGSDFVTIYDIATVYWRPSGDRNKTGNGLNDWKAAKTKVIHVPSSWAMAA